MAPDSEETPKVLTQGQADLHVLRLSVDRLERTVQHLQQSLDTVYARKDVLDPRIAEVEKDVASLQDWKDWAIRIVLGLVISGLVVLLIAQGAKP